MFYRNLFTLYCLTVSVKYGQGVDQVRAGVSASAGVGVGGVEKATNNYAMFSAPIGQQNLADVHRTQELRRRTGVGAEDSSGSAYVTNSGNGMTNMNGHLNGNMSMNMNMKASMRDYNGKPYINNSNSNGNSSSSSGDRYGRGYSTQNQHQLQLQQQQRPNRDMRAHLQGAEKVEKTIAQVITYNTLIQFNDKSFSNFTKLYLYVFFDNFTIFYMIL